MKPLCPKFLFLLLTLFTVSTLRAETNITIQCDEYYQAERINKVIPHTLTFDADKGYKNLQFEVYGSKLTASASFFMEDDGKMCGHSLDQICVSLKHSTFCTEKAEAKLYPSNGQPGDSTQVKCTILNNKTFPCPTEE